MKHYVIISGIVGGIIGSVLTTLLVSPVTAQRDKFGKIECTMLTVVDAKGNERIILSAHVSDMFENLSWTAQGPIIRSAKVRVLGTEYGGRVHVHDEDGYFAVDLNTDERGGLVYATGNNGKSAATLRISEHGGSVNVRDKRDEIKAVMGINKDGNGIVSTYDKNGYQQ